MLQTVLALAATVLVGLAVLAGAAIGALRTQWPPAVDAIRALTRVMNRGQLATAGKPGSYAGVLHHVGRSSGRRYATPLGIEPRGDDFVIAIVYGPRSDWLKNVLAAGEATIELDGETIAVDRPEVIPTAGVMDSFGSMDRFYQRLLGTESCLLLRRAEPRQGSLADAG
jgi:deazaflavin-dependent oxidoreductase (nitroreductase family)